MRLLASVCLSSVFCLTLAQDHSRDHKRAHNFDLLDVNWHISMDVPAAKIFGDVTNTLTVTEDNAKEIELDSGPFTFASITINGSPAAHHLQGEALHIDLPAGTAKGKTLKVRIVYSGSPEAGVYFVPAARAYPAKTPVVYTQGEMIDTRFWLPTYDLPNDKATSEGFVEVPKDWTVISNGKLVEVTDKGANKTFHWKMDKPHSTYLISFVAGPYTKGHEQWGDVPVDWYVPLGLDDAGRVTFGGTADIVKFYSELTGVKYPYPKFAQEAVPDYMFGGMENISAVTQTIGTLHEPSTRETTDSTGLVAHELAHQWFGDLITCADWSHIWLNEGWATFLPHFWDRKKNGADAYDIGRLNDFNATLGNHRPEVYDGYAEPIDNFDGMAYPGGSARMFMLMHELGEEEFWKAIKGYLEEYGFKNVTTEQFFASIGKQVGRDLTPFMKQWFYSSVSPNLTVSRDGDRVKITQPEPFYDLTVDLMVIGHGRGNVKKVHIEGATTIVDDVPADSQVILDPSVWLLAQINYDLNYKGEDWMSMYSHAPNAAQKQRLLNSALSTLSPEQIVDMAKSETSPAILEQIIGRVPKTQVDYLLEQASSPNARIRRVALQSLAGVASSPAVIQKLRSVWEGDPNEDLRSAALGSLLALTNDEALVDEAWQTDSFRQSYRSQALDWWLAHKPDIARQKALDVFAGPPREGLRVQAIRVLGVVKDKPGERTVYRTLVQVVKEHSFGARSTAMQALVAYGDTDAIQYIEPITHNSLHFLRRAAQGAVAALKK